MRFGVLLICLVLTASAWAFNVNNYLYYTEKPEMVSVEPFAYQHLNYTLVRIGGREIFLLREDQPLLNASDIDPPLRSYYREKYYAGNRELAQVLLLMIDYNDSRNNGEGIHPGKEEFACRQALFLDGHIKIGDKVVQCVDDDSCKLNALLVFQAYGGPSAFGSVETVLIPLKALAFATQDTEKVMARAFALLNSTKEEDTESALEYLQASIPSLRNDKAVVETSYFRTPQDTPEDREACRQSGCYPICPSLNYNDTALEQLGSQLNTAIAKLKPFAGHANISLQIENETLHRLNFRDLEDQTGYYRSVFAPVQKDGEAAIREGEQTLGTVLNLSLKAKVDQLRDLDAGINQSLDQRNITNIEDQLQQYHQLIREVREGIPGALRLYNDTVQARTQATATLMLLQTRSLGDSERSDLQALEDYYAQLDSLFRPGLTSEEYENITAAYQIVGERAHAALRQQEQSPLNIVQSRFQALARRIGRGVAQVIAPMPDLRRMAKEDGRFVIALSSVGFLALASLGTVIILTFMLGQVGPTRSTWIAGIVAIAVLVAVSLGFTGTLGFYMNKAAHNADLSEFLFDLAPWPSAAMVVDGRAADNATANAMLSCAKRISDELTLQNKSMKTYELRTDGCRTTNSAGIGIDQSESACLGGMAKENSLLVLNYSQNVTQPHLTAIFSSRMDLGGNQDYYRACAVSLLFRGG